MKIKCIGVWMDHSAANLMELTSGDMHTTIIDSTFTHDERALVLQKGEKTMHHKEQQQQHAYYKKIAGHIKDYQEVLLFGPTDAKTELLNLLKADAAFNTIDITTQQTGKMTENQQHAFVRNYFFKHLSDVKMATSSNKGK